MPTINSVRRPWVNKAQARPHQGRKDLNREVYGSYRWKKLSEQIRKEEPLCRSCKSEGLLTASKVVDHIVPINQGGDPWDVGNLQPLCKQCHERKSASEKH